MISATIDLKDDATIYVHALGPRLSAALARQVTILAIDTQARVKRDKLSGQVLKVRTGHLRSSIAERVETHDTGDAREVVGFVGIFQGPTLTYGRAHEFGFAGDAQVAAHERLGHPVAAHVRHVNLPERSFLRSTLAERESAIVAALQQTIVTTVEASA